MKECAICRSPSRRAINAALAGVEPGSIRRVARLFPAFSRRQIREHHAECLLRSPRLFDLLSRGRMSLEDFAVVLQADGKSAGEIEEILAAIRWRLREVA